MRRDIGDRCDWYISANLLNLEELKPILLLIQKKSEELAGCGRLVLHNRFHEYFLSPSGQARFGSIA
jgi:hypothetical protein